MNSSPCCSFTSSISPKQPNLTPYPPPMWPWAKKTDGFVYITSDKQWVNSWWEDLSEKLEALETSATEKLKDLSDTSGALATKVRSGWMKGRDDSGYRMLTWTCYKHTKSFRRVFDDDECLKMMVVLCLDFLDKLSLFCCARFFEICHI